MTVRITSYLILKKVSHVCECRVTLVEPAYIVDLIKLLQRASTPSRTIFVLCIKKFMGAVNFNQVFQ